MNRDYEYWKDMNKEVVSQYKAYNGIETPDHLYAVLLNVWCSETCAPGMREDWNEKNPTLGQCSITSFLAQDIFGGKVCGVKLPDGNFHCFNEVEGARFDLTSEQFGDTILNYDDATEQSREVHFSKKEKEERYRLLRNMLKRYCDRT